MKKCLLLVMVPILFSVALQGNVRNMINPEKPVQKTIQFSIYASSNYKKALYNHSKAKVLLSVWKYHGSSKTPVWQTIVDAGKLKNYPAADNALFREVSVYNVKDRKEVLVAGYKVIYDDKGSTLAYDMGYVVPTGKSTKQLSIRL